MKPTTVRPRAQVWESATFNPAGVGLATAVVRLEGRQDRGRKNLSWRELFSLPLPGLKENAYANTWLYRIATNTSMTGIGVAIESE